MGGGYGAEDEDVDINHSALNQKPFPTSEMLAHDILVWHGLLNCTLENNWHACRSICHLIHLPLFGNNFLSSDPSQNIQLQKANYMLTRATSSYHFGEALLLCIFTWHTDNLKKKKNWLTNKNHINVDI